MAIHFRNSILFSYPEVVGTMGQLPEGAVQLVQSVAEVEALTPKEPDNLAFVTQTTLSLDDTAEIVAALRPYVEGCLARGERLHSITRHVLGLYAHRTGARAFRRVISELAPPPGAGFAVLEAAVAAAEGIPRLRLSA